ncbi:flagellar biosynthetic protein FliR [Treponema pectinovorum]|uniref:flagellar biosynthetic protein FliR n=1 Tax=Treponema pectinovorum TaxID=164 RepID=UPI0011F1E529|nr:flagellar biosynthetic protein FliR [Treponema pectinovorum]
MLEKIVYAAPFFILVAARCFSLILTMPLFSMRTVSRIAKLALTGYLAYLLLPQVDMSSYRTYIGNDGAFSLNFILLVAGEVLIGITTGFYVSIIFAAFSTAGQFFAFQMGFSASEVYDALSQVENPLMGQFFNLIAMLLFLQNHGAQLLFSRGLISSFSTMNALNIVTAAGRNEIVSFMLSGLTKLFADAFVIALPVMGVLLLVSITTGILGKAAPQMNLLSEGFPIMILLSFFIITNLMNVLSDFFMNAFNSGFYNLQNLMAFFRGSGGQ